MTNICLLGRRGCGRVVIDVVEGCSAVNVGGLCIGTSVGGRVKREGRVRVEVRTGVRVIHGNHTWDREGSIQKSGGVHSKIEGGCTQGLGE